jgi:hypothetical protein
MRPSLISATASSMEANGIRSEIWDLKFDIWAVMLPESPGFFDWGLLRPI